MGRETKLNKKLTRKQAVFVKHVMSGESPTDAVMQSYDVKSRAVATSIGSENLRKPEVREAIDEALSAQGLSVSAVTSNIGTIANFKPEKISAETVLKANIELLKLKGVYVDRTHELDHTFAFQLNSLTYEEVLEELQNVETQSQEMLAEVRR